MVSKKDIQNIKFRASSSAPLFMGNIKEFTDKDAQRIKELECERDKGVNANGNKVKWTDPKIKELEALEKLKKTKPELPQGAKSYIERCVEELMFGFSYFSGNRETEKGTLVEDEGIALTNRVLDRNYTKSASALTWKMFTGHPDIEDELDLLIHDQKCPWSKATFKLKPEDCDVSTYQWQLRLYALMKSKMTKMKWRAGNVFFSLVDTPENLVSDFEDDRLHNVSHIPEHMRLTVVPIDHTDEHDKIIEKRGKMAVEYAVKHYEFLINKNK